MKRLAIAILFTCLVFGPALVVAQQQKIKIIADQDSAGPEGTNFLSLLMLLRAPQVDLRTTKNGRAI